MHSIKCNVSKIIAYSPLYALSKSVESQSNYPEYKSLTAHLITS